MIQADSLLKGGYICNMWTQKHSLLKEDEADEKRGVIFSACWIPIVPWESGANMPLVSVRNPCVFNQFLPSFPSFLLLNFMEVGLHWFYFTSVRILRLTMCLWVCRWSNWWQNRVLWPLQECRAFGEFRWRASTQASACCQILGRVWDWHHYRTIPLPLHPSNLRGQQSSYGTPHPDHQCPCNEDAPLRHNEMGTNL